MKFDCLHYKSYPTVFSISDRNSKHYGLKNFPTSLVCVTFIGSHLEKLDVSNLLNLDPIYSLEDVWRTFDNWPICVSSASGCHPGKPCFYDRVLPIYTLWQRIYIIGGSQPQKHVAFFFIEHYYLSLCFDPNIHPFWIILLIKFELKQFDATELDFLWMYCFCIYI